MRQSNGSTTQPQSNGGMGAAQHRDRRSSVRVCWHLFKFLAISVLLMAIRRREDLVRHEHQRTSTNGSAKGPRLGRIRIQGPQRQEQRMGSHGTICWLPNSYRNHTDRREGHSGRCAWAAPLWQSDVRRVDSRPRQPHRGPRRPL